MCNLPKQEQKPLKYRAEKTKTEMVLNMLKENLSVEMIARVAKLTVEQVMAISKKAAVL